MASEAPRSESYSQAETWKRKSPIMEESAEEECSRRKEHQGGGHKGQEPGGDAHDASTLGLDFTTRTVGSPGRFQIRVRKDRAEGSGGSLWLLGEAVASVSLTLGIEHRARRQCGAQ